MALEMDDSEHYCRGCMDESSAWKFGLSARPYDGKGQGKERGSRGKTRVGITVMKVCAQQYLRILMRIMIRVVI